ncbi:hypothetical protein [Herbidospora mongoliensis]|uniref:hypothetical protein n=1 Tax=Herbidospora mongoliensis TaxID=688067 RepID=UPI000A5347D4|nr:hypothetical protein [Herbidospora mongoliensis]
MYAIKGILKNKTATTALAACGLAVLGLGATGAASALAAPPHAGHVRIHTKPAAIVKPAKPAAIVQPAKPALKEPSFVKPAVLTGKTTASYFWDDASGRAGDTGLPASGKPMQKGMAASPSWPLGTEGYVVYKGQKKPFFVGDRGPGVPSSKGIMLDLDGQTFAELTGGTFDMTSLAVKDNGGAGHIPIEYHITKWGTGTGLKADPVPFAIGAWRR